MKQATPTMQRRWRWLALALCAGSLLYFACVSISAARTKNATYDEPLHSVAGFVHRTRGDFRINPEDPALFGYWGSLPHAAGSLKIVTDYAYWDKMLQDFAPNQWLFSELTLYGTQGNNGEDFLQTSRVMFTLLGVGLGTLIAAWAWQLGGPWAAVIACAFYALDPNFIGHSTLFKNDVMLSLMLAGLTFASWRFGRRGTWLSLSMILLCAAAAVNVKFSGVLAGPIVLILLATRGLLPQPWTVLGRSLAKRWQRLTVAAAVCTLVAVSCYAGIWACYRFRYLPTPDPHVALNTQQIVNLAKVSGARASFGTAQDYTAAALQQRIKVQSQARIVTLIVWAMDHHLLPQAWLFGFLFTYATTLIRGSFLMGMTRATGWWYYFPCVILFKTPTATLLSVPLIVLGTVFSFIFAPRRTADAVPVPRAWPRRWTIVCLLLPVALYMASAMTANVNLGLRHILPIYPYLFIAIGAGIAKIGRWSRPAAAVVTSLLLLGLAGESLAAYPDYIAFFNTLCGGERGGIKLLGDSNLDWGQDLKTLANWQKWHDDKPLYLAYFGIADPAFYGVKARNLPGDAGGWPFDPNPQVPAGSCYFAVSATTLQNIYVSNASATQTYNMLRDTVPLDILGGSIYIYQLPLSTPSVAR